MSNVPLVILLAILYLGFAGFVARIACRITPGEARRLRARDLALRAHPDYARWTRSR